MAVTQAEWITCPHCGSIFRVMVPNKTQRLVVCGYRSGSDYYARGSGDIRLVREQSDGDINCGGIVHASEFSQVGAACPKPGCAHPLWVFCLFKG